MVVDYSWVPVGAGGHMGGRNIISMLLSEARMKPHIAALVDAVPTMTNEQFADLKTPLPWHKKAIGEMRKHNIQKQASVDASAYADAMGGFAFHEPERGFVVRYTGLGIYWSPPKKNLQGARGLPIELRTGDILFVTKSDTWLGSTSLGFPNIPCDVLEKDVLRSRYFELVEREAPAMPTTDQTTENRLGIRFTRHM